jgi:hypothetical protein
MGIRAVAVTEVTPLGAGWRIGVTFLGVLSGENAFHHKGENTDRARTRIRFDAW